MFFFPRVKRPPLPMLLGRMVWFLLFYVLVIGSLFLFYYLLICRR